MGALGAVFGWPSVAMNQAYLEKQLLE